MWTADSFINGERNRAVIEAFTANFISSWNCQEDLDRLKNLGGGQADPSHPGAPTFGRESVNAWARGLSGHGDDPEAMKSLGFIRAQRWLSWVPQDGANPVNVMDLLESCARGDAASKLRLMAIGGVSEMTPEWVERIGNEAFRQSTNIPEWVLLMQALGVDPKWLANFLLGFPLDGVVRQDELVEDLALESILDLLWATGLFRTPLDLAECVRPGTLRQPSKESRVAPIWSSKTVWEAFKSAAFLGNWVAKFFEGQCHIDDSRLMPYSEFHIDEFSPVSAHPFPWLVRRYRRTLKSQRIGGTSEVQPVKARKATLEQQKVIAAYNSEDLTNHQIIRCVPQNLLL